jgi:2-polyprenyl-6-methoxyphenol hydroxylase-like FAD-dependent oxidoreductase
MKIVIIGGGISGCSLYLALQKHLPRPASPAQNHEYTIYEAYDTPRNLPGHHASGETHSATLVVGGGLGIGPNGLNVLKRLDEDLFHDTVRAGYPYSCSKLLNSYGWTLMRIPAQGGTPPISSVAISRHAIWNCLRSRVPDGVIVNKRVSEVVANHDGRNIIRFADDSPDVEADLVVGADGLRSTVKRALFPESKEDPFPPHYE